MLIRTDISEAFWCDPSLTIPFQRAQVSISHDAPQPLAWLDRLLEGGITIPDGCEKPLTMLITGPPGSAKSTLAFELCYRWALRQNLLSLFISLEAETRSLIYKANQLGFADVNKTILHLPKDPERAEYAPDRPAVCVWGMENLREGGESFQEGDRGKRLADLVLEARVALSRWLLPSDGGRPAWLVDDHIYMGRAPYRTEMVAPSVVVVDSLNILEPSLQGDYFEQFLGIAPERTKIVIFVLNSSPANDAPKFWEYVCDIVIKLEYGSHQDYYIRTIEISKARHQQHISGKHQLKIYGKYEMPAKRSFTDGETYNRKLQRAHPYRTEGGIFIYPSIHYYLSLYKKLGPEAMMTESDVLPDSLSKILKLPQGRCSALIGRRGGHKSHLGYLNILNTIIERDDAGLIVSLRDDESMTENTLARILDQEFSAQKRLIFEQRRGQLEVLYYPPGYITPEEFFHRMFMSIHRLKALSARHRGLTLLFNSLDQLSARFPLCAKEQIFVPGIVETLTGEGITSIFIAVEESGQPLEQYGLLPMADLILSSQSYRLPFEDYYRHLDEWFCFGQKKKEYRSRLEAVMKEAQGSYRDVVILQVVRHAGGHPAGDKGILELVEDDSQVDRSLYPRAGLQFVPLSTKYGQGTLLR